MRDVWRETLAKLSRCKSASAESAVQSRTPEECPGRFPSYQLNAIDSRGELHVSHVEWSWVLKAAAATGQPN